MPGPVRYTKSGKVKQAAPRKYESGKGWSKLTPAQQAAPSVEPTRRSSRRRQLRKAVSRGDFGRSFAKSPKTERKESGGEPIRPSLLPRKEVVAAVIDALSQPVDLPGTKFDKLGEMLSFLAPGGVVKGASTSSRLSPGMRKLLVPGGSRGRATVRGVSGLSADRVAAKGRPLRARPPRTARDLPAIKRRAAAAKRRTKLRWGSSEEAYANLLALGLDRNAKLYLRGKWWEGKRLTKKQQSLARQRARWADKNRSVAILGQDGYMTPPGRRVMK